ncbi:MAG: ABC transporter ATP-binding protein, partial [Rhodospirillaceae bacterium]|nr:ABC transporter ATP-binding protein [Rhodospirillaceae bacterium]
MKNLLRYWRFLAANGGVRRRHAALILCLGAGAVFAEALGLTMMLPVIEYIDLGGDLSALESKNAIWTSLIGAAAFLGVGVNLGVMTGFVVGAVILRQGFDYFHAVIMASVSAQIQRRLRLQSYDQFQTSRLRFVHNLGSGPFLNLMDRQAEGASRIMASCANFAKYVFTFVVYAGVMVAAAPLSSIASIIMMAFLILVVQRYVQRTRALSQAMIAFRSDYTGFVGESFRAARTVRIFGLQTHQGEQVDRLTQRYSTLAIDLARMAARVPLIIAPLIAAAVMGYLYSTFTYLDMTTGAITLFALILMRLAPSAQNFARQQQQFALFGANLEALAAFGDEANGERESSGGVTRPGRLENSVTFKDVSFTYPGAGRPSLDRVN